MNVFTATGNLGKDCRSGMAGSTAVLNFNLAVRSGFGDNEQTLWFDCAYFGKAAEGRLKEFLLKGTQVAVTGELGEREHEGKMYKTIRCTKVDLIGGRSDAQQAPQQPAPQPTTYGADANGDFVKPAGQAPAPKPQQSPNFDDFDDGIPF